MFEPIVNYLPESKVGSAEITHFEVSATDAEMFNLRALMGGDRASRIEPGKYVRLHINKELFMSDTPMEQRTNHSFVYAANGKVLIAGLGIGLVLVPLLKKESVSHITVIEQNQDVIDLVAPHFACEKLVVICADIFEWKPEKGQKFDSIYFDIWADVCTDALEEINKLHQRFKNYRNRENPNSFMSSWRVDYLRAEKRREYSYRYAW